MPGHEDLIEKAKADGSVTAETVAMQMVMAEKKRGISHLDVYKRQDERTGKLISTETVQREAFNAARKTRDMILNVPDKVIPLLIGKTDIHEMKEILRKELLRTLENLANLFDGNRD